MTISERRARTNARSCETCRVLEICPCPIQGRAVELGLDGLRKCEMYAVIEKVFEEGRARATALKRGK